MGCRTERIVYSGKHFYLKEHRKQLYTTTKSYLSQICKAGSAIRN